MPTRQRTFSSSLSTVISNVSDVGGAGYGLGHLSSHYGNFYQSIFNNSYYLVGSQSSPAGYSLTKTFGSFAASSQVYSYNFNASSYGSSFQYYLNAYPAGGILSNYNSGVSSPNDGANSYIPYQYQTSGNRGSGNTTNLYYIYYYNDGAQYYGMEFRPCGLGICAPGHTLALGQSRGYWALGMNYHSISHPSYFIPKVLIRGGGGAGFEQAVFGNSFSDVFDGNNFLAVWTYGSGDIYCGLVNRAQLRSGNISPLSSYYIGNVLDPCALPYIGFSYLEGGMNGGVYASMNIGVDEFCIRGILNPTSGYADYGYTATYNNIVFGGSGYTQYRNGRLFA